MTVQSDPGYAEPLRTIFGPARIHWPACLANGQPGGLHRCADMTHVKQDQRRKFVEVGGIEPPSPGDLSGLLRAQPVGRSRLEAPTGGGPLGQPGFDVRRRPPGGAVAVSLLTTPILPSQATGRGRLPSYLGSERVIVIGACVGPGF